MYIFTLCMCFVCIINTNINVDSERTARSPCDGQRLIETRSVIDLLEKQSRGDYLCWLKGAVDAFVMFS